MTYYIRKGWVCPKCGTAHAPWVPRCSCVVTMTAQSDTRLRCVRCGQPVDNGEPCPAAETTDAMHKP